MPGTAQQFEQFPCCGRIRNPPGGPRVLDEFLTGRRDELAVVLLRDIAEPVQERGNAPGRVPPPRSLTPLIAPTANVPSGLPAMARQSQGGPTEACRARFPGSERSAARDCFAAARNDSRSEWMQPDPRGCPATSPGPPRVHRASVPPRRSLSTFVGNDAETGLRSVAGCAQAWKISGYAGVYNETIIPRSIEMGARFMLSGEGAAFLAAVAVQRTGFLRKLSPS